MKLRTLSFVVGLILATGLPSFAQVRKTIEVLRAASVASTSTTVTVTSATYLSHHKAVIFLDCNLLTLPDATDKVCFYFQTTYDNDTNWTDIESVCFTNADDGTTAKKLVVIDDAKDGPGSIQATEGTDPAVNIEVSETVPANTIWRLQSLEVALTTDGTGTPRIQIHIDNGEFIHYRGISETTQPVSTTEEYIAGPIGVSRASIDGVHFIPVPSGLLMSAGHRIRTSGMTSGDGWAAPHWIVEAWHDPLMSTDGTMGDNLKSYDRPLGSKVRITTLVTDGDADVVYDFSASAEFR